jgi:hypothetical protein
MTSQERSEVVRRAHKRAEANLLRQALAQRPAPAVPDQYERYHVAAAEREAARSHHAGSTRD